MDDESKRLIPTDRDENVGGEPPKKKEKKRKSKEERKADRKVITAVLVFVVFVTILFYVIPKFKNWQTNGFKFQINTRQESGKAPSWGGYTEVKF